MLSSRPFRSIAIALLVLLGGSVGVDAAVNNETESTPASLAAARRSEASDEQLFVDKINELRTGLGLEPLTVHPMLVPLARDWADHLRAQGALSHAADLSVGVTGDWSRLGENVGVGPADHVQALFDAFVASPAHYANLVKPDYRYIGVGVVYGDDGRIWTAHRFMALASGASGEPDPRGPVVTAPPTTALETTATTTTARETTATTTTAPSSTATSAPPTSAPTARPTASQTNGATTQDPSGVASTTAPDPGTRPDVSPDLVEHLSAELADAGL